MLLRNKPKPTQLFSISLDASEDTSLVPSGPTKRRSYGDLPLVGAPVGGQEAETALAALRITSRTTSGFDNMGTWDAVTSVVVAFMRFETKCCRSG